MSFRTGSKVWPVDRELAWVEGEGEVDVKHNTNQKVTTRPDRLLPRDTDEDLSGGHVDDMTKLTELNESGVLSNLRKRYALNKIYTYTGTMLIAVNPFTKLPHMYDEHTMEQFKGVRLGDLSPHVFAVADASYSMFPKSTHETFSTKLFQSFRTHSRLEKTKFSETDFTLCHYAGKVTYQTDSFLDKNRDYVIVEHHNLLSSSKCPFVSGLFPSLPEETPLSSHKFSSVSSRFKKQLQALMDKLKSTEPHYIRCVKPNSLSHPQTFENKSVLHQLRCAGFFESVRISLAGFPIRCTYSKFVDRFGLLALELMDGSYDEKAVTKGILKKLSLDNFQLGRTKVFLRAGQKAILDMRRSEVLDNSARIISSGFRTIITRKKFLSTRQTSISIQAFCRGCLARGLYEHKRRTNAAVIIQKHLRKWLMRCYFLEKLEHCRSSAITIQCAWRQRLAQRELRRHRAANKANEHPKKKHCNRHTAYQRKQMEDFLKKCTNPNKQQQKILGEELGLDPSQIKNWFDTRRKKMKLATREESKLAEVRALQKALEKSSVQCEAAKVAAKIKCHKLISVQGRLQKEIKNLKGSLTQMTEVKQELQFH